MLWACSFLCRKNQKSQVSIELVQPFPALELWEYFYGHEAFTCVLMRTAKMTNLHSAHQNKGFAPQTSEKWRKWRVPLRQRHGVAKSTAFSFPEWKIGPPSPLKGCPSPFGRPRLAITLRSGPGKPSQRKVSSWNFFTGAFRNKSSMWIVLVIQRKKRQNSQKWAKFMNFSFWPFLWFAGATPDTLWTSRK